MSLEGSAAPPATTVPASLARGAKPAGLVSLEELTRLSKSILWELQRAFFEARGPGAWSQAIVPHYISSNPFVARAYAQQVLAFLRDATALGLDEDEPVYVVELAAGAQAGSAFIS